MTGLAKRLARKTIRWATICGSMLLLACSFNLFGTTLANASPALTDHHAVHTHLDQHAISDHVPAGHPCFHRAVSIEGEHAEHDLIGIDVAAGENHDCCFDQNIVDRFILRSVPSDDHLLVFGRSIRMFPDLIQASNRLAGDEKLAGRILSSTRFDGPTGAQYEFVLTIRIIV